MFVWRVTVINQYGNQTNSVEPGATRQEAEKMAARMHHVPLSQIVKSERVRGDEAVRLGGRP